MNISSLKDKLTVAGVKLKHKVKENPLTVGAIAVSVLTHTALIYCIRNGDFNEAVEIAKYNAGPLIFAVPLTSAGANLSVAAFQYIDNLVNTYNPRIF